PGPGRPRDRRSQPVVPAPGPQPKWVTPAPESHPERAADRVAGTGGRAGPRAGGRKGPVDQWRWAAGDRVVAMPRVAEEVSAGGLVIREFGGGPHGVLIARHDRRG